MHSILPQIKERTTKFFKDISFEYVKERFLNPLTFGIIGILLVFFTIIWFFVSFGPAIKAEAGYQARQVLTALGVQNLKDVFFPTNISFDIDSQSSYRDFGIVIPTIYLDEKVVFNVDPNSSEEYTKALKQGIAHASGTGYPGDGKTGYYFAHSSNASFRSQMNAIFYLLSKLEKDDEVYIWHEGERYDYKVINSTITSPNDLSFLTKDFEKETIVLQTCWPLGTSLKRKLVFAERVD